VITDKQVNALSDTAGALDKKVSQLSRFKGLIMKGLSSAVSSRWTAIFMSPENKGLLRQAAESDAGL